MGASDSKLVFKKGILRLSEERHIPADDPYWVSFWELPESSDDVFSLFAPSDIRRTRDNALENLETLILAVTSRLFMLRHHPSFPDADYAPDREVLNCIRVLTRLLPFIFEADGLAEWEDRFFWGIRRKKTRKASLASEVLFDEAAVHAAPESDEYEETKPLAEELIDTLIELLFFSGFTVQQQPNGKDRVSFAIWQSGVGCNSTYLTTKEFENNRCEVLRLLITIASQSLYMTPPVLTQNGIRSLSYMCTSSDKQAVLSILCSLMNTTLKYNPTSWRVPYNSLVLKDTKQALATYSLQLLLILLLYPIPEGHSTAKNVYRHFLGRLHRPQDFQFMVDGMTRILNQPLQEKTSLIPSSHNQASIASEVLMLFWEVTQSNKRFRAFIVDTERARDFVVLALFYALEYRNDASRQGVVRMCAFLLQTLSVEKNFGINLNGIFEGHDSLPVVMKVPGFRGSYADFLIHSIYTLFSHGHSNLSAIYPALLAVLNNVAPYLQNLTSKTCNKIMLLFTSMSSPSFLLANDSNHDLLRALLESINSIVEHQYEKNPDFIYAVLRHRKRIEALRSFTLESGQEEIERRQRSRKDSSASTEPYDPSSRRSSVDSSRGFLPPASQSIQSPGLGNVPEDSTFEIGDDSDADDDEYRPTPPSATPSHSGSVAGPDDVPVQLRGMSEKARGKLPAGAPSFSRQNSLPTAPPAARAVPMGAFQPTAAWIESWLPELPLHTLLMLMQQLGALIPRQNMTPEVATTEVRKQIQSIAVIGLEPSLIRVHSFEWGPMALGWYESLLWALVFTSQLRMGSGGPAAGAGAGSLWNGTAIKLFRVQETAPAGPTLTSPRGAVDAVGSNIVSRIGAINLRAASGSVSSGSGNAGMTGRQST
ncbi:hypothetical protein TD95_002468 [Thielaviopsis punctulata]|uniref:High-temperature-induced dauer-formation protein n=1 Tax=Thielaviopsis punctulata TaxID=72032 RepID=A0A0F4ZB25_9PEZI|nr:hypothetical protein TD95_002468 [Thielaviopsis punctulata]